MGRNGVDTLLVASQVALLIVLPIIVFPLLVLSGSRDVMRVWVLRAVYARNGVDGNGNVSARK